MAEQQLTRLQKIILDIDRLNLPLRDSMRLATQQIEFFVGQQRYVDELRKAKAIVGEQDRETA
jgi:hypothetical protein